MAIKTKDEADQDLYYAYLRGDVKELPESWTRVRPQFDIWMYVDKDTMELKGNTEALPEDAVFEPNGGNKEDAPKRRIALANDGQLALIRSLLEQVSPIIAAEFDGVDLDRLSKKDASSMIDRLKPHAVRMATDGQRSFITSLHTDRDTSSLGVDIMMLLETRLTFDAASKMIDTLKACPVKPAPVEATDDEWTTLAGELADMGGQHGARFAVDTEDDADNDLAFWVVVRRGTRIYLNQYLGGHGPVRVRMTKAAQLAVVKKIHAAGPMDAMLRFGRELGTCGHCGIPLTNDASRAAGIGPKCRTRH